MIVVSKQNHGLSSHRQSYNLDVIKDVYIFKYRNHINLSVNLVYPVTVIAFSHVIMLWHMQIITHPFQTPVSAPLIY